MGKMRVLAVDDIPEMLERVVEILEPDFDVVGECADGPSAIAAAERLKPDLIVLDISMPGLSGLEVGARLKKAGCSARIVYLTNYEEPAMAQAAKDVGAYGYVAKRCMVTDLLPALFSAAEGKSYIWIPA